MERRAVAISEDYMAALMASAMKRHPDLAKPEGVQAQVTVIEYQYMGDCAAYMRRAMTYDPNETVADLLKRAHPNLGRPFTRHDPGERIELQVIPETIPEAVPEGKPAGSPWDNGKPF